MNREEVENMQAGEKMNIEIAVKVFGWIPWLEQRGEYKHVVWQRENREPWMRSRDWEAEKKRYTAFYISDYDPYKHVLESVPNFSGDISAAWMVVHKMSEKNFWAYVGSLSSVCYCVFYDGEGNHQRGEAPIYQEPLAICRAALLAVTP